ncbi:MAG: serine/threonine protein kinase [Faecousia sp.]
MRYRAAPESWQLFYYRKGVFNTEITITFGQALTAFVVAMGIPSAITGFLFWNFERKITIRDKKKEQEAEAERKKEEKKTEEFQKQVAEREKAREAYELNLVKGTWAAIALGEATARAVQRIPDAHCNGDMHKALSYAEQVKHDQKEFLAKQGIQALWE